MPSLLHDQRSPEWFEARRGRITASLAAACLGLDPYRSPLSAWKSITGAGESKTNRAMRWGVQNEPQAVADYEVISGSLVQPTGLWVHPEHDWLGASPDGLVEDDGLLEIKCPSVVPTAVPLAHRIQCLVQLAVTGRSWVDYFAWAGNETYLCRVRRCQGIAGLVRRLERFYRAYIMTSLEPPRRNDLARLLEKRGIP